MLSRLIAVIIELCFKMDHRFYCSAVVFIIGIAISVASAESPKSASVVVINNNSDDVNRANSEINVSLMQSSIVYGVLTEAIFNADADDDVDDADEGCKKDLRSLFNGINNQDLWAIKGLCSHAFSLN